MKSLLSDGLRLEPPFSNGYLNSSNASSVPVGSLTLLAGNSITPGGSWNIFYYSGSEDSGYKWNMELNKATIPYINRYYYGPCIRIS